VRKSLLAVLGVAILLTAGTGAAQAGATRTSKSVAGVRATLDQWANYLLTDKPQLACAMLTTHGQAVWATTNKAPNCVKASKADYSLLKKYPSYATTIRDYGNVEPVTLHGNRASLPKLSGGTRTLIYKNGVWFIDS
jgi:hypothetical protein